MIRDMDKLLRDQSAILSAYREQWAGRAEVAVLPRPGGSIALAVYGRVCAVVASDADHGPHLLVMRQRWGGVPPTVSDASDLSSRCYPTPNHAVGDYTVGEYVRMVVVHGAMVAEKLV